MSDFRTKGRRPSSRAFRPTLDGMLEDRFLLPNRCTRDWNLKLLKDTEKAAFRANKPEFTRVVLRSNRGFRTSRGGLPDDTRRSGRRYHRHGWLLVPDPALVHHQYGATAAGDNAARDLYADHYDRGGSHSALGVPAADRHRAGYAMPNGEVGIIVDGSSHNTELTINPLPHAIKRAMPIVMPMASRA